MLDSFWLLGQYIYLYFHELQDVHVNATFLVLKTVVTSVPL